MNCIALGRHPTSFFEDRVSHRLTMTQNVLVLFACLEQTEKYLSRAGGLWVLTVQPRAEQHHDLQRKLTVIIAICHGRSMSLLLYGE